MNYVGYIGLSNSGLKYEIVRYQNSKKITIRFIESGYETNTSCARIIDGAIKDLLSPSVCGIGFIGVGIHSKKSNPSAYAKWKDMLTRCYSESYQSRQRTYIGCSVCDEWHNFQIFAEWFGVESASVDGHDLQLDKDMKVSGNKIYGPMFCCLVSHKVNSAFSHSKEYEFESPSGEIVAVRNLHEFCKDNGLHHGHMSMVSKGVRMSHKGWRAAKRHAEQMRTGEWAKEYGA